MDEKIEEKVGKELYNDLSSIMSEEYEKHMLITPSYCANKMLEKGYRKESDTAREILTELKPIIINYLEEYMENGSEEAPKYFESLCKKYGVDLGE